MALCMSVGSAVAWLIALYTERGVRRLLWDFPFATAGAALCALAIAWIDPRFVMIGLVTAGPLCAALMIFAGDAIRRALVTERRPTPRS
jgi:uncharacterized membrane protein YfcA